MLDKNDFVFVRRLIDGATLDIPKRDLETTLKRGGFELIEEAPIEPDTAIESSPQEENQKQNKLGCDLCGKEYKTEKALDKHSKMAHR